MGESCSPVLRPAAAAVAAFAAALFFASVPREVRATEPTCGYEPGELVDGIWTSWYSAYDLRLQVRHYLIKNGNAVLAAHFHRCAIEALRKGAEQGVPTAQYYYALELLNERPRSPEREAEAREWLRKAAVGGVREARLLVPDWNRRP
jgi:TPR repeat protein